MAFHEIRFPEEISYGSSGGPGFDTSVVELDSGAEERVSRRSVPRRQWDIAEAIKSIDDLNEVKRFFIIRGGSANGFRFKDFMDFTTAANDRDAHAEDDHEIGVGDGTETQFQLRKQYSDGTFLRNQPITKPVVGTVLVAVDGVSQTEGADFTVDTTTGIITFMTAPGNTLSITAGCEIDWPVRFGLEVDKLLSLSFDGFDVGSTTIPIIEIISELESGEDFFFGGGKELTVTADTQIGVDARVLNLTTVDAALELILPLFTNLAVGGPYFYIFNNGANAIDIVETVGGTVVINLAAGDDTAIVLGEVGAAKIWLATA